VLLLFYDISAIGIIVFQKKRPLTSATLGTSRGIKTIEFQTGITS